jgi:hypothetical protein
MRNLTILVVSLAFVGACKKSEQPEAAKTAEPTKPDPKPEPMKPEPVAVEKAKPDPAKADPTKKAEPSAKDIDLVTTVDKTSFDYTSPTGEKVKVEARKKLKGTWIVEMVVDGKVVETFDSKIEKDDIHYEASGAIGAAPEGVVFVSKIIKVTGKASDTYEARILAWDAAKKQLAVSRKFEYEASYQPGVDD